MIQVTLYRNDNSKMYEECEVVKVNLILNRIALMSEGQIHTYDLREVKMIECT